MTRRPFLIPLFGLFFSMQLTGGLVLCGLAALASANPQGGFFGGLGGLFNRFQGRPQGGGGGGGGGCRPSGPNHNFGGRNYLVSWRLGCTQFSQVKIREFPICMIKNIRVKQLPTAAATA
jgi:hypothetical protein